MGKKYKASELVKFFQDKIGTNYVYGMRGTVMTEADYQRLKKQYGDLVWDSDIKKCNTVCVDCSGMFQWFMGVSKSSAGWHDCATEIHPISTIKDAPVGAMVWHQGHIGINVDGEYYLAADGSAYGVRKAKYSQAKFTHWMLNEDYFEYDTANKGVEKVAAKGTKGMEKSSKGSEDEMVEQRAVIVNGEEYTVNMIVKDDYTFIKTRDLGPLLGFEVTNEGKTPILKKKDR